MLKIKSILIILGIVLMGLTVQAEVGALIEPMVTYERGDSTIDYPSPFNNSTGTISGVGVGGRFGFHLSDLIFLAVDARYSKPQFKDSTNDLDATATSMNYGPSFGVQMPIVGLRLFGTYVLGGELDPEESQGVDLKFTEATGPRLGVGFQIVAFSLNLEYQELDYGKTTLEKLGPITGGSNDINLKDKSLILSASFPINL